MTIQINEGNPFILGMGISNPDNYITTEKFDETISKYIVADDMVDKAKALINNICIEGRHLSRDFTHIDSSYLLRRHQTIGEVNKVYIVDALKLTEISCLKAIQEWGGSPKDLTHFVTATCTGQMVPDINVQLIPTLGLNEDIHRVSSNFNGCCAGYTTMRIATDLARANKNHRVLVCCTELCSHQVPTSKDFDIVIASFLFGDGSAAYVMGSELRENEKPLFEVIGTHTAVLPNTQHLMTYAITSIGWDMHLDPLLGPTVSKNSKEFIRKMVEEKCNENAIPTDLVGECEYLIHPGGPGIIRGICKSLGITEQHARHSWNILKKYGNMSSASVLFTMNSARYDTVAKPYSIGIAMGPGLVVEGVVLKNHYMNNNN
ncbi:putative polyketide synthase [Tieghemostelium lacteum]|uniref:Putative polyketide synthase n=1 Tax=Tieghemostelium lacteum TaxID=361077 RepID=A0A151ZGJ5_TIELA|nr:putative polyketide synthase [Tieghemostelium lacteum]|eukprot:KYQ93092.1 putative polyketide synthase [Tieghemostelium lacteum]